MGLYKDGEACAQRDVAMREARRVDAVDEARGRVVVLDEAGVEGHRERALGRQPCGDAVAQRAAGLAQSRIAGVHRLAGDRDRSEEHTSELQSLMRISYAVFCLKKKNTYKSKTTTHTNNTMINDK